MPPPNTRPTPSQNTWLHATYLVPSNLGGSKKPKYESNCSELDSGQMAPVTAQESSSTPNKQTGQTFRNLILLNPVKVRPNISILSVELDQEVQKADIIAEGPFYEGQGPLNLHGHTHLPHPHFPSPQKQKNSASFHSNSSTKLKSHFTCKHTSTSAALPQNLIESHHHVIDLN